MNTITARQREHWFAVVLVLASLYGGAKAEETTGRKGTPCIEDYAGSSYPPGQPSEMQMAKYLVRSLTGHSGLDMEAGPCHPHFTAFPHPQSLCRQTWPVQTVALPADLACADAGPLPTFDHLLCLADVGHRAGRLLPGRGSRRFFRGQEPDFLYV